MIVNEFLDYVFSVIVLRGNGMFLRAFCYFSFIR